MPEKRPHPGAVSLPPGVVLDAVTYLTVDPNSEAHSLSYLPPGLSTDRSQCQEGTGIFAQGTLPVPGLRATGPCTLLRDQKSRKYFLGLLCSWGLEDAALCVCVCARPSFSFLSCGHRTKLPPNLDRPHLTL